MRRLLALVVLLAVAPAFAEDEPAPKKKAGPSLGALVWARETVQERLELGERAPEFAADRDWLNVSRPLTLAEDLRGKVVILDFWCYCCINCLHVLPDLHYLEERYADKPFAVVGVHSAKFTNEKDARQIREAVLRNDIHHPVVNDADFAIWRSYGAKSWPTFAVIAPDGTFIGVLSGEGNREDLDALVQALLEHFEQMAPKTLSTKPLPMRLEKTTKPPGQLAYPGKVLADAGHDRLFIADSGHHRIIEVGLDGRYRRAFGDGVAGLEDGTLTEARFRNPQGMAIHAGALWVCDTGNHAIRRIDLETGAVTTAAGTGEKGNHWRRVHPKREVVEHGPWPGKTTALSSPWDILFLDGVGHIAMAGSHSMWSIDPTTHEVRHTAGDLSERRLDAEDPYQAAFAQPSGLATDGKVLFIADSESSAILQMTPGGAVVTLAGAERGKPKNLFHYGDEDGVGWGKRFQHPLGVAYVGAHVWVADAYNHKIKRLEPKRRTVRSMVGTGAPGLADGPGATFAEPSGLSYADGVLYVADTNNHAIRRLRLPARGTEPRAVDTLRLRGVPIPAVHARGGLSDVWPVAEGRAATRTVKAAVSAQQPTPIEVALDLPLGWKLNPDAPSVARLQRGARHTDVAIKGPGTRLELPAWIGDAPPVTVRLHYYVCSADGACQVRSVDIRLDLTVAPGAQGPIRILERFDPLHR